MSTSSPGSFSAPSDNTSTNSGAHERHDSTSSALYQSLSTKDFVALKSPSPGGTGSNGALDGLSAQQTFNQARTPEAFNQLYFGSSAGSNFSGDSPTSPRGQTGSDPTELAYASAQPGRDASRDAAPVTTERLPAGGPTNEVARAMASASPESLSRSFQRPGGG